MNPNSATYLLDQIRQGELLQKKRVELVVEGRLPPSLIISHGVSSRLVQLREELKEAEGNLYQLAE